jgi:hypothetical protein
MSYGSNMNNGYQSAPSAPTSSWNPFASSTPTSTSTSTYQDPNQKKWYHFWGGKRRKSRRFRGGSFLPNTDMNIASYASPYSGSQTAQPHNLTRGGKRRTRRNKRRGSRRRRH